MFFSSSSRRSMMRENPEHVRGDVIRYVHLRGSTEGP